jgi:hypothetical protein
MLGRVVALMPLALSAAAYTSARICDSEKSADPMTTEVVAPDAEPAGVEAATVGLELAPHADRASPAATTAAVVRARRARRVSHVRSLP